MQDPVLWQWRFLLRKQNDVNIPDRKISVRYLFLVRQNGVKKCGMKCILQDEILSDFTILWHGMNFTKNLLKK